MWALANVKSGSSGEEITEFILGSVTALNDNQVRKSLRPVRVTFGPAGGL